MWKLFSTLGRLI